MEYLHQNKVAIKLQISDKTKSLHWLIKKNKYIPIIALSEIPYYLSCVWFNLKFPKGMPVTQRVFTCSNSTMETLEQCL